MSEGLKIGLDVDECCASMLPVWLDYYNAVWDDDLRVEQITDWDLTKFSKCGADIYKLLRIPGFYDQVRPVAGYQQAVRHLRELGADVFYVSACVPGTMDMKLGWLQRHDPDFDWKRCIFAYEKALLRLDVLLDDAVHNLVGFGGLSLLMDAPYNQDASAIPGAVRVRGWDEVVEVLENYGVLA
jgi:5'-nucleotidase